MTKSLLIQKERDCRFQVQFAAVGLGPEHGRCAIVTAWRSLDSSLQMEVVKEVKPTFFKADTSYLSLLCQHHSNPHFSRVWTCSFSPHTIPFHTKCSLNDQIPPSLVGFVIGKHMNHNAFSLFPSWSSLGDITKNETLHLSFCGEGGKYELKPAPKCISFPEFFSNIFMTKFYVCDFVPLSVLWLLNLQPTLAVHRLTVWHSWRISSTISLGWYCRTNLKKHRLDPEISQGRKLPQQQQQKQECGAWVCVSVDLINKSTLNRVCRNGREKGCGLAQSAGHFLLLLFLWGLP